MVSLKKILLVVFLLFVFSCCAKENIIAEYPPFNIDHVHKIKINIGSIERFVDIDANVVCYAYKQSDRASLPEGYGIGVGLSCIPLSETDLEY